VINNINLQKYVDKLEDASLYTFEGAVKQVVGLCVEANGPSASVGDLCYINTAGEEYLKAEIVL